MLSDQAEIEITDFVEDPADDCAFAVKAEVRGPGKRSDTLRISFTEDFVQKYFHIPWYKKLPEEEHRILSEKRDLFVKWALVKIEQYLDWDLKESVLTVDYDHDGIWAHKIADGLIPQRSQRLKPGLYTYLPQKYS